MATWPSLAVVLCITSKPGNISCKFNDISISAVLNEVADNFGRFSLILNLWILAFYSKIRWLSGGKSLLQFGTLENVCKPVNYPQNRKICYRFICLKGIYKILMVNLNLQDLMDRSWSWFWTRKLEWSSDSNLILKIQDFELEILKKSCLDITI